MSEPVHDDGGMVRAAATGIDVGRTKRQNEPASYIYIEKEHLQEKQMHLDGAITNKKVGR